MIGTIETPHADIELGVERRALRYLVRAPSAGVDKHTGLALFIVGYGMEPFGAYAQKLLAHLADRHNCVAVSVDYFGANFLTKSRLVPCPDFFVNLAQHYGIRSTAPAGVDMIQLLLSLAHLLRQHGISRLADQCQLTWLSEEYHSMGFLPALDGLEVTHRLLDEFSLDRRRLFVIGTSYGGYIASMMSKLAPNTFRMIIDNSGFSSAEDDVDGVMGFAKVYVGGVAMVGRAVRSWSRDPASAAYFSTARRAIRDLRDRTQVKHNTVRLYAYHAAADTVAPTAEKLRLREAYDGRVHYDLSIVDEAQLDSRLFKTLEHGMKASLRGLFDLSYEKFVAAGGALADHTDFDLATEHRFACGGEDYVVRFAEAGVRASIERNSIH